MDIVIDTSALIAVIANEPERGKIIKLTAGHSLIGPNSIPWEIGNAFSAMFKQDRFNFEEAKKGGSSLIDIPLRYIKTDFVNSILIAKQTNMYAYDAYILDCSLRFYAPLLTLDKKLKSVAQSLNITILEV